jgi:hypothetical protein
MPSGPRWIATDGIVSASWRTSSDTLALTKSPGQSSSSSLANNRFQAHRCAGLVDHIVDQQQRAEGVAVVLAQRVTSTGPRAMASRTSLSARADSVNGTADGFVSVSVAIGEESEACTILPGSTMRTPLRLIVSLPPLNVIRNTTTNKVQF